MPVVKVPVMGGHELPSEWQRLRCRCISPCCYVAGSRAPALVPRTMDHVTQLGGDLGSHIFQLLIENERHENTHGHRA
jgi:hypothetical protein